jgi:hypothetical protein
MYIPFGMLLFVVLAYLAIDGYNEAKRRNG